jgi:hypothetical protein
VGGGVGGEGYVGRCTRGGASSKSKKGGRGESMQYERHKRSPCSWVDILITRWGMMM